MVLTWQPSDIVNFIQETLLAHQVSTHTLDQQLHDAINFLIQNNMIEFTDQTSSIVYKSTQLGMATHRSSFAPDHEALIVNQELQHAMTSLVLSDELHLCYLITPLFNLPPITDWMGFFKLFGNLDPIRLKIAEIIGINESFLYKQAMSGVRNSGNKDLTSKSSALIRSAIRFFYALVLEDLLNETPIFEVQKKFSVNRGTLQSLLQSAQSFAMQSVNFCKTLEYWALSDLLASYCKRLNFGVKPELVPLTEIKGVKKARARALYNAGFRSVRQISLASPEEIARSVNLGPYGEGAARNIIRSARELLEKKAKELREAAEDLLV